MYIRYYRFVKYRRNTGTRCSTLFLADKKCSTCCLRLGEARRHTEEKPQNNAGTIDRKKGRGGKKKENENGKARDRVWVWVSETDVDEHGHGETPRAWVKMECEGR